MRIFGAILIVLSFISCSNRETDEMIVNGIFQDLTFKMNIHNDGLSFCIPPPPIDYENDSLKLIDSLNYQKAIENYKSRLEEQRRKGNNIVLGIGDSLINYKEKDLEYLKKELPSKDYLGAFYAIEKGVYESTLIDLNSITKTGNYKLLYLSTFYPLNDFWQSERDFKFSGFLQFSRIYLDNKRQYGIFYCSYSCGNLCGHGDFVLIKKINGVWTIEKTIEVWIS